MNEERNNNHQTSQVLLSVLAVAILVVAVVGVSFAFFTYSKQGTTTNTISTGTLVFSYNETGNGVNLTNAMPISDTDATGTALTNLSDDEKGEFEFTVASTLNGKLTIDYDIIVAETSDPANYETLDSKYVRLRLLKDETAAKSYSDFVKPTFFDSLEDAKGDQLISDSSLKAQKVLGSGTFTSTGESVSAAEATHYYKFQMWFSDRYYLKSGLAEDGYKTTENEGNGNLTQMTNDACVKSDQVQEEVPAAGKCSVEGNTFQKGTNGKTFTVKINVVAKDQQ